MSNPASHPASPPEATFNALVLLVDDQAMVGEAVRRMIARESDMDFQHCADAQEAVTTANRIHPTVILLDLLMPDMDGLTLLRQLRDNPATRETPILVLSVREDAVMKERAFEQGANDYLVKLPDRIELVARLRYHSRAHLLSRQRDEAFHALKESELHLTEKNKEMTRCCQEVETALAQIQQLRELLPMCGQCKRIRDDKNYWQQIEKYLSQHTEVKFSHSYCPECYDEWMRQMDAYLAANPPGKGGAA
ncbi:MAG TPA: response regulator [Candidatus Acidoferrales bacterium]|jgi:DNA-binding response OmpR family regulator|nr:response regulator [Candidatus Acidoferrales bacterium]